ASRRRAMSRSPKLSWRQLGPSSPTSEYSGLNSNMQSPVVTGKPPSDVWISTVANQLQPPVIPVGLPSALLERRPDIAAAERQVAAANEQIGIAKSALYPALSFSASAGSQTTALFPLPIGFWSLGPQLVQTCLMRASGMRKLN